ncbi:MAG: hypothetical protein M1833_002006 [Piccolia ochrophora]|nr:MAG: hypothetical protein M1833_002006 [Piccolia ochrophora]
MESAKSVFSSLQDVLNKVLPFTTPGTPLSQDIIHTLILCTILWFAPQIVERYADARFGYDPVQTHDLAPEQTVAENEDTQEPVPEPPVNPPDDDVIDAEHLVENHRAPEIEDVQDDAFLPPEFRNNDDPQAVFDDDVDLAGPANPPPLQPHHANAARTRDVGKKKAKSLARKDQRRAYHEFMRSQGDAQRAQDRAEAAEREAELAEERKRRAMLESTLEERRRAERERKKMEEVKQREEDIRRRKKAVNLVREQVKTKGWVDLNQVAKVVGDGIDQAWVERLCRADGLVSNEVKDGQITMITGSGFLVTVTADDMRELRQRIVVSEEALALDGRLDWADVGDHLEHLIRRKKDVRELRAEPWDWKESQKLLDEGEPQFEETIAPAKLLDIISNA